MERSILLMDVIQNFHTEWLEKTFPENTADDQLKGVLEELGELARAELKHKQKVATFDRCTTKERITDAVGDLFFYLCGYCSKKEIRLADCIDMALREICTRDWDHFVETGEKRYNELPPWLNENFWA